MENINDLFEEQVEMIDVEDIEKRESRWGNGYRTITKKQIKELQRGKVIYIDDGEYCHFIKLEK